jgi:hypothetical protein
MYELLFPSVRAEARYLLEADAKKKASDAAHNVLMTLARTQQLTRLQDPLAFLSYVSSTVIQEARVINQGHRTPETEARERDEVREMLRELDEGSDAASQKLWAEDRDVLERFAEGRYDVTGAEAEERVVRARLHLRIVTGH